MPKRTRFRAPEQNRRRLDRLIAVMGTRCRLRSTVAQTVGNEAWTAIVFQAETYDPANMHTTAANTRITFPTAGPYRIGGNIQWAANATGRRGLRISVSGGNSVCATTVEATTTTATTLNISSEYEFTTTHYIELEGLQASGGNLNINKTANTSAQFWASKMA